VGHLPKKSLIESKHLHKAVRGRRETPHAHRDAITAARAQHVHHAAREDRADSVREREGEDDVTVVDLAPRKQTLQRRLPECEGLTVDVVDRDAEEQQRADRPVITRRSGARCGGLREARVSLQCWLGA